MPNKNYLRGTKFERELVNEARKKGLISARSAGSHSAFDLYIVDLDNRHIRLVQCKVKKTTNKALKGITVRDQYKSYKDFFVETYKLTKYTR